MKPSVDVVITLLQVRPLPAGVRLERFDAR